MPSAGSSAPCHGSSIPARRSRWWPPSCAWSSPPHGRAWLLDRLWERLGLPAILDKALRGRRRDPDVERVLFAMVANRALEPMSKLSCAAWVRELAAIPGPSELDEDRCYRTMDRLLEVEAEVAEQVYWSVATVLDLEVDPLFLDTTSTDFETDAADPPSAGAPRGFRAYGHSEDHRPDLPQVVIGLAVPGRPVPHEPPRIGSRAEPRARSHAAQECRAGRDGRMRIEKVEGLLIGSDLVGANYVVRITTDSGLSGVGQSGAWGFPDAAQKVTEQFTEYLVGKDPFRIEHIQQTLYRLRPFRGNVISGALSAIDIALWDIKGKHFGVPVWELLGGKVRDTVRLHLLLKGDDPDEIRRNAVVAAEEGFTALKFDPLQDGYEDQTLARLIEGVRDMGAAAREAVGLDVDLIFELHRKLTPMQGVAVAEALAEFRPLFIEDPIQIDSVALQAELAKRFTFPLANGERLSTIWEFRDLLAAGGPQHLRPDVGIAGGLTSCRKIAALAEAYHSALVLHNFLGALLTAASVHLDVTIPNFLTQEFLQLDESPLAPDAIFRTTVKRVGGYIPAPEAPGIGVEIDDELFSEAPAHYLPPSPVLRSDGSPAMAL